MLLEELKLMQNYPLWMKIEKTKKRIQEWYEYYNGEVYVSFSGGKDSTVLLDIVRSMYPEVEAVYVDTGLEYPEIKKFVKTFKKVKIVRPDMPFNKVIDKYGYPIISKEQSLFIYQARNTKSEKLKKMRINGIMPDGRETTFKISDKWKYLLDAPFKISHMCCDIMKKRPIHKYEKISNKMPMIGTMADESKLRQQAYLRNGCNAFESKRPISTPLGFWKQQDVLEYIYMNKLSIASVYGDVVKEEEKTLIESIITYRTTGCDRTGCVYCAFGSHLEVGENRFQRLKRTHPQLHKYCMDQLGMKEVLEYINVKYE